jgi:DNA end-binding protein Ku
MAMIEEKVKHPDQKHPMPKAPKKPSNVIDLMSVLEESLSHAKGGKASASSRTKPRTKSKRKTKGGSAKTHHRKAA